jgi:CBS domain-containing protein
LIPLRHDWVRPDDDPDKPTKGRVDMTTAKELMHPGAECVPEHETLDRAAQMMRNMQVGSLPICGSDDRLKGILTDRDIVVKCIAEGKDPSRVTAAQLAQGKPVYVNGEDSEDTVLRLMEQNAIRRVPVIENHKLIGMISEADLAQHLSEDKLAHFVSAVTQAPPSPAGRSRTTTARSGSSRGGSTSRSGSGSTGRGGGRSRSQ